MLSFFTGIWGKVVGVLALLTVLGSLGAVALRTHDKGVLAMAQVSQDKAISAARQQATDHEIQALQDQQVRLTTAAAASVALKAKTHAAVRSTSCLSSPAVNALLNGVRSDFGPNGPGSRTSGAH